MPVATEARWTELQIELPEMFPPLGNYLDCKQVGNLLYVGGHGPTSKDRGITGKVSPEVSLERGQQAARATALPCVATVRAKLGSLYRVKQVVNVFDMVNPAPGFNRTRSVIDGCSDVLVKIYGEAGRHTRFAVGMAELPFGIGVEIEMALEVE